VVGIVAVVLLISGAVGCGPGDSSATDNTGGAGGSGGSGGGPVCPDDPADVDGAVPEACGIWVSAGLGNDANDGTTKRRSAERR